MNTNNPIKFNLIRGFLRDHIYTKVNASEYPRNGTLDNGDKIYTTKKKGKKKKKKKEKDSVLNNSKRYNRIIIVKLTSNATDDKKSNQK